MGAKMYVVIMDFVLFIADLVWTACHSDPRAPNGADNRPQFDTKARMGRSGYAWVSVL